MQVAVLNVEDNEITFPSELIHSPFPESYIDDYGNRNDISSEETIDVELDKAMVYVRPWNTENEYFDESGRIKEDIKEEITGG